MKLHTGVCCVLCLVVSLAAPAIGQTGQVSLDHVDGLNGDGDIIAGETITFHIRFYNDVPASIWAFSNGFRLYSPDGATWQPPSYAQTGTLAALFDQYLYYEGSLDGSGSDTIGFTGLDMYFPQIGMSPGFSQVVLTISTQVDVAQVGRHLCLGSSGYAPYIPWEWALDDGETSVTPTWSGPHCYEIAAAELTKTIVVLDEFSSPIANKGFHVYRVDQNPPTFTQHQIGTGELVTDGSGCITLPSGAFVTGDWIKLERKVHTEPARRHVSELGTMYTIWLDNADFNTTTGDMSYDAIDSDPEQSIQVNHATLCYNLLVSVEWDASITYLSQLQENFAMMSNYLYDVTDGQCRIDTVVIYDDGGRWTEQPDYRIHADNSKWPSLNMLGYPGAIRVTIPDRPIEMPRKHYGPVGTAGLVALDYLGWNASFNLSPDLREGDDYRTKAHEFGHYALGFWEENKFFGSRCESSPPSMGFMDHEYRTPYVPGAVDPEPYASEMSCSATYSDGSCRNTWQWWFNNNLSCWDMFYLQSGIYDDVQVVLKRPEHQILPEGLDYFPGPNDDLANLDFNVGSLIVFPIGLEATTAYTATAKVHGLDEGDNADVYHETSSGRRVKQGKTADRPASSHGLIKVLGYRVGDQLEASGGHGVSVRLESPSSGTWLYGRLTVAKSGFPGSEGDTLNVILAPVQGDYPLVSSATLNGQSTEFHLQVYQEFSEPPIVELRTDCGGFASTSMTESGATYTGSFGLSPGSKGSLTYWAMDDSLNTFFFTAEYAHYDIDSVSGLPIASSADGMCDFILDTSQELTRVMVLSSTFAVPTAGLTPMAAYAGCTYALVTDPNGSLMGDNQISIHCGHLQLLDSSGTCDLMGQLTVFRWDENIAQWLSVFGSSFNEDTGLLTADITQPGIYAAFTVGDGNGDGIHDGCESCCGLYTSGSTGNTNCDVDGKLNLSDITAAITRVYIEPSVPLCCEENGDVNCDTKINLADITQLITKVYLDPLFELCECP